MRRRTFLKAPLFALLPGCSCFSFQRKTGGFKQSIDNRRWLQQSFDRGGHITLDKGGHYIVSSEPDARAALYIRSDTFLDLCGARLELAPGHRCSLIGKTREGPIRNIKIANGLIIGNGSKQPSDYRREIGITPTIYLPGCDHLELENIQIQDAYMYAVYVKGNYGSAKNIRVEGAVGGGIHIDGRGWRIDEIDVRNVSYFERVNCQGNPFIVSLQDSQVGGIHCQNYGFGVKFQDGCENLRVDSIEAIAGPFNYFSPDYLVKIQGKKDDKMPHQNRNVRIGSIVSQNGPYSGLYIFFSDYIQIDSYFGEKNGQLKTVDRKNRADVLIMESDNVIFGELRATGFPFHGLWVHEGVGKVEVRHSDMEATESCGEKVVVRSGMVLINGTTISNPDGDV